jgi:hypothetical protein
MKDIEIAGLDSNGHYIFAQGSKAKDERVKEKVERLKMFTYKSVSRIYFGPKSALRKFIKRKDRLKSVDIESVPGVKQSQGIKISHRVIPVTFEVLIPVK